MIFLIYHIAMILAVTVLVGGLLLKNDNVWGPALVVILTVALLGYLMYGALVQVTTKEHAPFSNYEYKEIHEQHYIFIKGSAINISNNYPLILAVKEQDLISMVSKYNSYGFQMSHYYKPSKLIEKQ